MRRLVCVVALVWFLFGLSIAQEVDLQYRGFPPFGHLDYNSSGFGARSRAMGGVYMALNLEGFNSFLNPACMVYTDKSVMSLEVLNSQDEYKDKHLYREVFVNRDPSDTVIASDGAGELNYYTMDGGHTAVTQAGAVAPFVYFDRDWWFGGGFRTVYDLHVEFDTMYASGARNIFTASHGIDALNLSLATKLIENVSVGANMNYYIRGYESNLYNSTVTDNIVSLRQKDKASFTGTNFDFGAVADFDIVRVGFVVRTGFDLTQKSVYFHSGAVNVYGDDVGEIDRITVTTKFPLTYGGGIAVTPIENFMFAADVDFRPYSKVRADIDHEHLGWADINEYDPDWQDLTQLRLGAEYVLDAGFAEVPLRAGFRILPSLKTNGDYLVDTLYVNGVPTFPVEMITEGEQIKTNIFSFGSGLAFDKIWIDVAYEFGSSEYENTATTWNGETFDEPLKYDYSRLHFSVGMLF